MSDSFALLQTPRRPWPDLDGLKTRFVQLSAAAHPDKFSTSSSSELDAATAQFAAINSAYNCLRDPRERLAHLLSLETGEAPRQVRQVPIDLADAILPAEQLCREARTFLTARARAESPMVKLQFFEQALEWTDRLQEMNARLHVLQTQTESALTELNDAWAALDAIADTAERRAKLPLARLDDLFRRHSYLSKFTAQLQELAVQMTL